MNSLSNISTIKEILGRHGFHFSKALGQNFLINPTVCPRMAEESGASPESGVLEVGPGIGVLTRELAESAQKVVSVELDRRLLPVLEETLADYDNVTIVNEDVLKLDIKELLEREFAGMPVSVCANLPYYITSPVIMRFLEERLDITALTVMVQKEAARRICAKPGTRECGAVTIAVHYYAEPEILFEVSRGSFMPAPNVDSSVIRLTLRKEPAVKVADEAGFFKLVRAAFGQRRKTMLNSVSAGLSLPKETVGAALDAAGLDRRVRAEQLTMQNFADLFACLNSQKE
ncbi:MAG: 16S rRNA (adenine(1518)-N(6)/adenine(1519)-N(6))-dimethyltransferase RsmA [Clostridium sp.]|uniref:16S rRNA (adenine(1518)-N(6)/adenine(1519)-N(6))- dimethyltransferase RsmA n=1 Tax=Clostridium sp. TaxID=1506 RepID=UPI0029105DB5|nr:16S rRNA (adenine(1518)-N(6)/adenine(1519)-N(6))-dimethyltransferase RsmA [Clostridium sp.]MDU7337487.1 16S rRNA (adenine(1518)-N(6)/adenine(1519)-N(6))-dimethyltransferase RsmA [Clostridium sp.]